MTPRQQTAPRLTRELQALGAMVTNVLPLADGQNPRFWVSDYRKNELLQQLKDGGYEPVFVGTEFQACIATYDLRMVNKFEIPLPSERQPMHDDKIIRGE